ncbi:outer membrane protein transport protein [Mangrovimonas sp. AS39]|uniref:OmpP1/FadL family transporter n=1 Tax=Mangrovimonas futianensis TaxID=2895523 RepID=UPI001E35F9EC|nr:outer membrane protein transport protein [Mangrovimonas futianensis]MCF1191593.1 outer membrane protein transport protein [Mangrovimonas futianensis]MCF1195519.1 outer membrane protein transport protein [Mangrovimonas futianensis]
MKTQIITPLLLLVTTLFFAQSGHIMQGVGAVNMSMGGAATGQPLDISGALQWNPAAISQFDHNTLKLDVGLFFSSPKLYSTVPEFGQDGQPTGNFFSGSTADDRGSSVMPNLAYIWSKEGSKHTFGFSAFGISGFGVTFPESMTNPVNMPQSMGGFGRIESDYMLLQIGLSWAYELSEKFSIGVQPNFDFATLELMPNPTMYPNSSGYPSTDKASALGFGAQFGVFYKSEFGFKAGVSYKTKQSFADFEFDNTYPNGETAKNNFQMDYPAIFSIGLGYSLSNFDFALDYRFVDYENTEGFANTGWTENASVAGFGWNNISIVSAGIQFRGINKLPLRLGYTYNSNPIPSEVTFYNIPATAVIKNAYQFGLSYLVNKNWQLDGVFHYGDSSGKTSGSLLNPMFADAYPPYGAIPYSEVSYDMTTSMIMLGISYKFNSGQEKSK